MFLKEELVCSSVRLLSRQLFLSSLVVIHQSLATDVLTTPCHDFDCCRR